MARANVNQSQAFSVTRRKGVTEPTLFPLTKN